MFNRILIANRGEIAVRIIKTAKQMGIHTIAVYSKIDSNALFVKLADEAHCIGNAPAKESYLNMQKIIDVAKLTKSEAIHPGYGFLSENAEFAHLLEKENITFIGPKWQIIQEMGSKAQAKKLMQKANVPLIPGYHGDQQDSKFLLKEAKKIGFPILLKASLGGGGKGMRIVHREQDFEKSLTACQREAESSFGDNHIIVEKYITNPRHIEVQIFGDNFGNIVHLYDRDCSIQRRHQKIIEEAPSTISAKVRKELLSTASLAAKSLNYNNAGTIEFIMDEKENFYFMEMNTRLQVEHPVTEMITGQNLVEWQIKVAAGEKLPLEQNQITVSGHSLEARIYAEDPENNFLPTTGTIYELITPNSQDQQDLNTNLNNFSSTCTSNNNCTTQIKNTVNNSDLTQLNNTQDNIFKSTSSTSSFYTDSVRLDCGIKKNDMICIHYDPLLAKLIVKGNSREDAIRKLKKALMETHFMGIQTNIAFLRQICFDNNFIKGNINTHYTETIQFKEQIDLNLAFYITATAYFVLSRCQANTSINTSNNNSHNLMHPWNKFDNWRLNTAISNIISLTHKDDYFNCKIIQYNNNEFTITQDFYVNKNKSKQKIPKSEKKQNTNNEIFGSFIIINSNTITITIENQSYNVTLFKFNDLIYSSINTYDFHFNIPTTNTLEQDQEKDKDKLTAPMPGVITKILIKAKDKVIKNQPLLIIEAMKMEHTISAPCSGIIKQLHFKVGDTINEGVALLELEPTE